MIVGISGYARSGKDEAANVLVEQCGFKRVAFADKLREVLYQLNPLVAPTPEGYFVNSKTPSRLQEVIDDYGWDGYKETEHGAEIRRLLQRLGTEAGRNIIGDNIWVDLALNGHGENNIVIPDTRFPNEAQAIVDRGGVVVRINRKNTKPVNPHISETALDNWPFDWTIENDWSLEKYHTDVLYLKERFSL